MGRDPLVELFLKLVSIDSESFKEGEAARFVVDLLQGWGVKVGRDRAGRAIGSDADNLYVKLPSRVKAPPLLLSAHLDTVSPGSGVRPVVGRRTIRSAGRTVLGADDKAGVAIILDILRDAAEGRLRAGPLEALFSIAEEEGVLGIRHARLGRLKARQALVLDGTGEAGVIVNAAPAHDVLDFVFRGRRAHAGVEPEKGVNAISGAARAVARMKLGRLDAETTANIGIIEGGCATNIVPEEVRVRGEVRSRNPAKLERQRERMIEAARAVEEEGLEVEVRVERAYEGYLVPASDPLVRTIKRAGAAEGLRMRVRPSGGGSDANFLNASGIRAVVLNTGAYEPHSEREYLDLAEFKRSSAVCRRVVEMFAGTGGGAA